MNMKMNFKLFIEIMTNEVLSFRQMWDMDEWNESYISFKYHCNNFYKKEYVEQTEPKKLVVDWGKDFYQPATKETHNYWVK